MPYRKMISLGVANIRFVTTTAAISYAVPVALLRVLLSGLQLWHIPGNHGIAVVCCLIGWVQGPVLAIEARIISKVPSC